MNDTTEAIPADRPDPHPASLADLLATLIGDGQWRR